MNTEQKRENIIRYYQRSIENWKTARYNSMMVNKLVIVIYGSKKSNVLICRTLSRLYVLVKISRHLK